ncbi:MAG: methyltransferase domain-containing protein [Armatimonadetes bacterium]|nr:methyltransferase domain-containing protein [Armatimonadota bacterium]
MTDPHPDYHKIAGTYDKGRALPAEMMALWLDAIHRRGRLQAGDSLLDLGCGTGRFSIPLAETGLEVFGLDGAPEMIGRAVAKPGAERVRWVAGEGMALPFREGAFQTVFLSMVLHHIQDRERFLKGIRRVLRPGGACVLRTSSHDQIRRLPEYRFFPRAMEIDLKRMPDTPVVENLLRRAGFDAVLTETVPYRIARSLEEYIEKVRHKHISALTLLTEEEFEAGFRECERSLRSLPPDGLGEESLMLIAGYRG